MFDLIDGRPLPPSEGEEQSLSLSGGRKNPFAPHRNSLGVTGAQYEEHRTASGTLQASSQSAFHLSIALAFALSVPCRGIQTWKEHTFRFNLHDQANLLLSAAGTFFPPTRPRTLPFRTIHGAFALPRHEEDRVFRFPPAKRRGVPVQVGRNLTFQTTSWERSAEPHRAG